MAFQHTLKIISTDVVAPKVKRLRLEKPKNFKFIPGHSAMISLPENKKDSHPFTFTSTNDDPYLEFHIKCFENTTKKIHTLKIGDTLVLADIFGSIRYVGPGLFIIGGQAITPCLAIFRQLKKEKALAGNVLLHSVQTTQDLFCQEELHNLLKENYHITLTQEKNPSYFHGRITLELIKQYLPKNKQTYVLGSDEFVSQMKSMMQTL